MLNYWERKARLLRKPSEHQVHTMERPSERIRLASVVEESIVDGPGVRFVLFTQGCPHRCPGCHNPQTHLLTGGALFSLEKILSLYEAHPACRGITLSGGEPFLQAGPLAKVARAIQAKGDDVIAYTGYRLEQLQEMMHTNADIGALLSKTDLLIDGPFLLQKRSLEAPFVGSSNQRLIALSKVGNRLLDDIPTLPQGPSIRRTYYEDWSTASS